MCWINPATKNIIHVWLRSFSLHNNKGCSFCPEIIRFIGCLTWQSVQKNLMCQVMQITQLIYYPLLIFRYSGVFAQARPSPLAVPPLQTTAVVNSSLLWKTSYNHCYLCFYFLLLDLLQFKPWYIRGLIVSIQFNTGCTDLPSLAYFLI